jgi:isopentenyl-diphosphate delta-isomerase
MKLANFEGIFSIHTCGALDWIRSRRPPDWGRIMEHETSDSAFEPKVVLVDEHDRALGVEDKLKAHQTGGRLHRSVSVWIFNSRGELLMQKRSRLKYHSAGLWSNTCCGHPLPGEEPLSAARRRLHEEMGIVCDLQEKFTMLFKGEVGGELTEWEYAHVFAGKIDGSPKVNRSEVQDWKWITLRRLKNELRVHPNEYTIWQEVVVDRFLSGEDTHEQGLVKHIHPRNRSTTNPESSES